MRLFWVIRHGCDHDPDGADGPDTNFIVRAENHADAAALADEILRELSHEYVCPFAHCVFEIGIDAEPNVESQVVVGPAFSYAYNRVGYAGWERDELGKPWTSIVSDD